MRAELIRLHKRLGLSTTVYVTHDQVEALTMGDRVAVLKDGDVMQVDTPSCLYDNPANTFVASFIGSPRMNLLPARLLESADGPAVAVLGIIVPLHAVQAHALRAADARAVQIGLRASDLRPPADIAGTEHTARLQGVVDVVEHTGSEVFATVQVNDELLVARFPRNAIPQINDRVELAFNPSHMYFFDAGSGERLCDRESVLQELGGTSGMSLVSQSSETSGEG
jgi:multiple sugar transport system ATP-binding protein